MTLLFYQGLLISPAAGGGGGEEFQLQLEVPGDDTYDLLLGDDEFLTLEVP